MKNVNVFFTKFLFVIAFIGFFVFLVPQIAHAVPSLSGINSEINTATTNFMAWAKAIVGVVIFIGLIGAIYAIITNHPKAKEYVIAVIVAIIVYAIVLTVMN